MLSTLARNLLKGIGLALAIATGFSAWVTVLRLTAGTGPFERLGTTYPTTVTVYYLGGLAAGTLIGCCWPLHRWPLGTAFLGVLGTFPLYLGVGWAQSGAQFPTPDNIAEGGVSALLVGVPVGLWFWCDAHPRGPPWLDALRYPSPAILPKVWIAAVLIAGVSYFGVTRWSASWPAPLVVLSAFVLFVGPLALALVVTLRAGRRRDH